MKTAIIYASVHHKNTEKLVSAVSAAIPDVLLLNATSVILKDLSSYDVIGIASGIYMSKFHKSIIPFLNSNLPEHKKVFIIYTSGSAGDYGKDILPVIQQKQCTILGTYNCRGYDTFGPFKLVGGLCKGHPDEADIAGAVDFVRKITDKR